MVKQVAGILYTSPELIPAGMPRYAVIDSLAASELANLEPLDVLIYSPEESVNPALRKVGVVTYRQGDTIPANMRRVSGGLLARANEWQAQATRVHVAGIAAAGFTDDSGVAAGVAARTYLSNVTVERCRQDGYIRQVTARIYAAGAAGQWIKFKVFRPNGANYDYVGESEQFTIPGTGDQVFTLTQPIACQPGDILGCALSPDAVAGNRVNVSVKAAGGLCYAAGDLTVSDAFASTLAYSLCLDGFTNPPYLCGTGDSIAEGHGGATPYNSFLDGGPGGDLTHEIWHQLRGKVGSGALLQYQNHGKGSQTFAWVLSTGIPSVIAALPKVVVIHCGVNDVSTGREWAAVLSDLNAIKALLVAGERLLIDEILPWTAGTDVQAGTVRTFNASLATWCAANNATLVRCHDEMGQTRVATGELDDLLAAYDEDGVHLTTVGVDKMADIIRRYL